MIDARIGVIEGDGIGPEIMPPALEALDEIARQAGRKFGYVHIPAVGRTLDKGYLTADLYARYSEAPRLRHVVDYAKGHRAFEVSTAKFSRQVVKEIKKAA